MSVLRRALRGMEAGAVTAGATAAAALFLDLARFQPLAAVGPVAGPTSGPGAATLDLGSLSDAIAMASTAWHVTAFAFGHVLAFVLAGILASLLFDWSRLGRVRRFALLTALCVAAFYATTSWSSPVVGVEAAGWAPALGLGLFAALILGGGLYVAHLPEVEE